MSAFEKDVRDFARQFNTINTQRLVWLAEQGQITWSQAATVASRSLAKALAS